MKRIIALVTVLLIMISVPVMALAAVSPTGESAFDCETMSSNANAGSVTKADMGDSTFKVVALPTSAGSFKNWTITGEYTIVSGSLDSAELVVKAVNGDIKVVANFNGEATSGDDSSDAPQTGDSVALFVLLGVISLAGMGFAAKKAFAA